MCLALPLITIFLPGPCRHLSWSFSGYLNLKCPKPTSDLTPKNCSISAFLTSLLLRGKQKVLFRPELWCCPWVLYLSPNPYLICQKILLDIPSKYISYQGLLLFPSTLTSLVHATIFSHLNFSLGLLIGLCASTLVSQYNTILLLCSKSTVAPHLKAKVLCYLTYKVWVMWQLVALLTLSSTLLPLALPYWLPCCTLYVPHTLLLLELCFCFSICVECSSMITACLCSLILCSNVTFSARPILVILFKIAPCLLPANLPPTVGPIPVLSPPTITF